MSGNTLKTIPTSQDGSRLSRPVKVLVLEKRRRGEIVEAVVADKSTFRFVSDLIIIFYGLRSIL